MTKPNDRNMLELKENTIKLIEQLTNISNLIRLPYLNKLKDSIENPTSELLDDVTLNSVMTEIKFVISCIAIEYKDSQLHMFSNMNTCSTNEIFEIIKRATVELDEFIEHLAERETYLNDLRWKL